ncbi:MAG: CinA family nicotinamide mononucleotide deamidase-related protein [Flavobacterium sp.]
MKATILTIGDEILIGQITDTNSGYIAKSLEKIGIQVHEMLSISDDQNHILNTLHRLQNQVDLVIITGGLGPTKDDITKKTLCTYFEDTLVKNEEVEQHVLHLFQNVLGREPGQINLDQALVPSKCTILHNAYGTAPGMWIAHQQTIFVSMPGVPYEMKGIVDHHLVPKLVAEFQRPFILHQTLMTYGEGESVIAQTIEAWENQLPAFIKLAYLPSPGRVRLRLTARGNEEALLKKAMQEEIAKVTPLIQHILVGMEEEESIEQKVQELMLAKKMTLATAESCTGGKIASALTQIPGSSGYFVGSVVSYQSQIKEELLGVSANTIQQHSVVSEAVALEMAKGVLEKMNVDYAIATTGNAGPSKKDSDTDLGTVCIAVVSKTSSISSTFTFGQPRSKVIDRAVNKALEMLWKEISKK